MKPFPGLSQLRLRPLLVIGELLLIAALAFMASQRQLTLVLLLPLGVGLVLTFLRWPSLGLIVASLAGLVVPFLGPSGLNVTMILVALLLGLWLLDMMVRQRQIQLAPSRTLWPLLSFLVIAAFSFGVGQLPWLTFAPHAPLGAQLGGLSIIVLSAGTFLLVANQVRDLRWLSRITWAFLAIGALSVLVRSVLPALGLPTRDLFQPVGTVFYIWLVAMAFSQAVFNRDLHPGWRLALGGLGTRHALRSVFFEIWRQIRLAISVCLHSRYHRSSLLACRLGAGSGRSPVSFVSVVGSRCYR